MAYYSVKINKTQTFALVQYCGEPTCTLYINIIGLENANLCQKWAVLNKHLTQHILQNVHTTLTLIGSCIFDLNHFQQTGKYTLYHLDCVLWTFNVFSPEHQPTDILYASINSYIWSVNSLILLSVVWNKPPICQSLTHKN